QNSAGVAQSLDDGGVACGDVAGPNARGGGRWLASHVDEILDRDRHAVQRTAIDAAAAFLVDRTGHGARALGVDKDERVGTRAVLGDGGEACVDTFGGGGCRHGPPTYRELPVRR